MATSKKVQGTTTKPSFENSAIGKRFIAPAGYYIATVTPNDKGGLDYTQILLDNGKTVTLVNCEVQVGKRLVKAEIAVADSATFDDVAILANTGGKCLIQVTHSKGNCYSQFLNATEILLLQEKQETEATAKVEDKVLEA